MCANNAKFYAYELKCAIHFSSRHKKPFAYQGLTRFDKCLFFRRNAPNRQIAASLFVGNSSADVGFPYRLSDDLPRRATKRVDRGNRYLRFRLPPFPFVLFFRSRLPFFSSRSAKDSVVSSW